MAFLRDIGPRCYTYVCLQSIDKLWRQMKGSRSSDLDHYILCATNNIETRPRATPQTAVRLSDYFQTKWAKRLSMMTTVQPIMGKKMALDTWLSAVRMTARANRL